VSGVTVVLLPVDDDGFDEADWLVGALAFALADDEALVLAVADALAEAEALAETEDTAAAVGAGLAQVVFGVGWTVFLPVPPEVSLGLGLGLGDTGGVVAGVPPGLSLGLTLALGLVLALAEALALALVVPPLLWLPLDDVAGTVVVAVTLVGELVLACVVDWCAEAGAQEIILPLGSTPPGRPVGNPPPGVGAGALPAPSVPLVLLAGLPLVKA